MTDYLITKATLNRQTDVLSVEGYALDTGKFLTATGWVSATTNYYTPDSYNNDGSFVEDATSRKMSNDELKNYILDLIRAVDVRPVVTETPEPVEEDMTDLFN